MPDAYFEEFLEIQFFGEYLIDRWVITREQLLAALDHQMKRNERLGTIAVKRSFLTEDQVLAISDQQRKTDKTFGELAVEMGYLTHEQLDQIIHFQRNNNIYLGEVLLRLGFVTEEVLKRELTNFRQHQRRHTLDSGEVLVDHTQQAVIRATVDLTRKMLRRLVGVLIKVGTAIPFESGQASTKMQFYTSVAVDFMQERPVRFVFSVNEPLARRIMGSLLRQDASHEPVASVKDAVKEFANIICGNAVAKLAHSGLVVDIGPPAELGAIPEAPEDWMTVAYPCRLLEGGADLRFFAARG